MTYQLPPDVAQLVRAHMATGVYASEDDVLRDALHALGEFVHDRAAGSAEYRDAVAAAREGLADAQAGRVIPLRELLENSEPGLPDSPP